MTEEAGERARVEQLLGRPPRGAFVVAVRTPAGDPVVIQNAPLLADGTPMPTRYWLVGPAAKRAVDRLEAAGGVNQAEAAVDPVALAAAHERYAAERDAALPADWAGNRPSGGVGGTRRGVKCLHAHYAWFLAGGDDPVGRWVAARLVAGGSPAGLGVTDAASVAAIDCGTNSTRLLIAGPDGTTRQRLMRITRLGQGVDRHGRLAADAIARTVGALSDFAAVMSGHGVGPVRMTATSAARDATNRQELFDAAERAVGVRPELLSGEEEGRLSFTGATATLDPASGPWLVVDIGGGSTELVAGPASGGDRSVPAAVRSLDMGCVRITERFLAADPPGPAALAAASNFIDRHVEAALAEQPGLGRPACFVGLAGTVSAAAVLYLGLAGYDRALVHHSWLPRDAVDGLLDELAGQTTAQRRERRGMETERADVIVGGLIVLSRLLHLVGASTCLVSESDILDGLVASLLTDRPAAV